MITELLDAILPDSPPDSPDHVVELADAVIAAAMQSRASDLHIVPTGDAWSISLRIDGVMHHAGTLSREVGQRLIVRLKVMAQLLTYRTELPQEGRIHADSDRLEMRLSSFPTLHGEKAVIRLFDADARRARLDGLDLKPERVERLRETLSSTAGALIIAGPAGSGKTTTAYACLREILDKSQGGRSLVSMEDPVEVAVTGVAQSQVNAAASFEMAGGLKALLRQDPDVILVGEIRDRETSEVVFQASLTGHLVLSTFHAGSAAQAVSRLFDMDVEPYLLRSGLLGVLSLRLVRSLCECRSAVDDEVSLWSRELKQAWKAAGCSICQGTGYVGRIPASEFMLPSKFAQSEQIIAKQDSATIEQRAVEQGFVTQVDRVLELVEQGQTSPAEAVRVLSDIRHQRC